MPLPDSFQRQPESSWRAAARASGHRTQRRLWLAIGLAAHFSAKETIQCPRPLPRRLPNVSATQGRNWWQAESDRHPKHLLSVFESTEAQPLVRNLPFPAPDV